MIENNFDKSFKYVITYPLLFKHATIDAEHKKLTRDLCNAKHIFKINYDLELIEYTNQVRIKEFEEKIKIHKSINIPGIYYMNISDDEEENLNV